MSRGLGRGCPGRQTRYVTPALIASDLDGTLLRTDGSVSPRSVAALRRLTEAGIPFAMVTGRPIRWLPEVLSQTGVTGPVVCANGAAVYDPAADEVLTTSPLRSETLAEVIDRLRAELPEVVFAVEIDDGRGMISEAGWPSIAEDIEHRIVAHPELLASPAVKLLARLPESTPDEFLDRCAALLDGAVQVTSSAKRSALVEISAIGVSKASGLAWLADHYGAAPEDVLAYGDMVNDVPMFGWAGRGVAVANAHPALLAVADEVTASNDEDGVALHLERVVAASGAA